MFQNMGGMGNTSDQSIQHKLFILKNNIINERIEIIGLTEVNSNWSKITMTENIYNRMDGCFKISTGYKKATISSRPFQSGGTSFMAVDEVAYRGIGTGQEFRNLGRWSWMLLQGNNNMRYRINTVYYPTASTSSGGAYSKQLKALPIMEIQNAP